MLLRHNPLMKKIYKFYANSKNFQKENSENLDNENILGLNLAKFWNLVKDLKIMSPKATIVIINRLFYQGAKNRYDIQTPINELKRKLAILKEASENNDFPTLDTNELFVYDYSERIKEKEETNRNNDSGFTSFSEKFHCDGKIKSNINIHDGGRVILYRHFVEMIIRIAYLNCGDLNELHRSIEKIILQKMTPLLENKKKKGKEASFHSSVINNLI